MKNLLINVKNMHKISDFLKFHMNFYNKKSNNFKNQFKQFRIQNI